MKFNRRLATASADVRGDTMAIEQVRLLTGMLSTCQSATGPRSQRFATPGVVVNSQHFPTRTAENDLGNTPSRRRPQRIRRFDYTVLSSAWIAWRSRRPMDFWRSGERIFPPPISCT